MAVGATVLALIFASDPLFAQPFGAPARPMPFGIGGAEGAASPPSNALVAWLIAQQSAFYMKINAAVRAATADGTAVFGLVGLSFLYGVFHAAGPGHGKAVIASYLFANERALSRGTLAAFLAAALQGLVAIALIAIMAGILRGTAQQMTSASGVIEIASYAAVLLFGLALSIRKGRALLATLRPSVGAAEPHVHDENCGHMHMPGPEALDGKRSLRDLAGTVVAAGLRPCTGAILVLVYALSQGIFLVGIGAVAAMSLGTAITTSTLAAIAVFAKGLALRLASGGSRSGQVVIRGLEFAAALVVALLGALLLTGLLGAQSGA